MEKRKIKTFFITLIVLFVFFGALYFGIRSISYFDIRKFEINVSGPVTEPSNEVLRIVQPCKGKNIFAVSLPELKDKLKNCFGVKNVKISRFYPDKLIVDLEFCSYLTKIESGGKYYVADNTSLFEVEKQTFDSFSGVRKAEIDSDYCVFLEKWGYDEGFFRAATLISDIKSNLITLIKYDNNNGNEFGRLVLELEALGVQLYVCEAVSAQRVDEAIEVLREAIKVPEKNTRYDLYSDSLIKRS